MMESLKATLTGTAPLLMHNGRTADPLDEWTQTISAVASKRKKTLADYEELRRLKWHAALYQDGDGRIGIPADCVLACMIRGAMQSKLGPKAKAGVVEARPFFRIDYDGPRNPDKLYATKGFVDYRAVAINRSRVFACRPRFAEWRLEIELLVEPEIMNPADVMAALEKAGEVIGLCDYRPRFGRFTVVPG